MPGKADRIQARSSALELKREEVTFHAGPLPPPQALKAYDRVLPGAAKEILEMAKKAQDHSIYMDRQEVRQVNLRLWLGAMIGWLGQFLSAIVAMAGYAVACVYVNAGEPRWGALIAGTSTILCGYLIWWKPKESKESKEPKENRKRGS